MFPMAIMAITFGTDLHAAIEFMKWKYRFQGPGAYSYTLYLYKNGIYGCR